MLKTASEKTALRIEKSREKLSANEKDLCFLTMHLTDENGTDNLQKKRKIHILVEGEGTLQGFGSGDPQSMERYDSESIMTYDGYALAAVRAGKNAGEIRVIVWMEGYEQEKQEIVIPAKESDPARKS